MNADFGMKTGGIRGMGSGFRDTLCLKHKGREITKEVKAVPIIQV